MPRSLARARTPLPTAVPKARFSQSSAIRKSSNFLLSRFASSSLVEHGRSVTARGRSDLENVFIAPLGNNIGRRDRLPMDNPLPLRLCADRDSEWRSVCAGDQLDAVLADDPLGFTFPGAGIGCVTADESDFVTSDAAFFIDHVPGNFHRHVRLVPVLRPWSGERLQDSNLDVLGQCRSEWEAGETSCEHEPRASTQKSLQLPCH